MGKKSVKLSLLAIFAGVIFVVNLAQAGNVPPTPDDSSLGEADGDMAITGSDLIQHKNQLLGKKAYYDTLQPAGSETEWNTCDVDGDQACTGLDVIYLSNNLLLKKVVTPDDPWALENPDEFGLPAEVYTDSVTPFVLNLYSVNNGPSGRPGVPVVGTIIDGGGSMGGRECNPDPGGGRDQIAQPGASCALSVTWTDWAVDRSQGLTESGPMGFSFTAPSTPGLVTILFTTKAVPGLDIPATSLRLTVMVLARNLPPTITSSCSSSATEGVSYVCDLTATDPDAGQTLTWSKTAYDACGGTLTGSTYSMLPDETKGGTSCVLSVQVADNFSPAGVSYMTLVVTVAEVNLAPTISSIACSSLVNEGQDYSCRFSAADADLPAQTLTYSLAATNTCGGTMVGNLYYWPSPESLASTCVVSVKVTDSGSPTLSATKSISVYVVKSNQNPKISGNCAAVGAVGELYSCALTVTDQDLPAQIITVRKSAADTCGGLLTGSVYSWTPYTSQGDRTCVIGVEALDNWSTPGYASYSSSVAVIQPKAPVWSSRPMDVGVPNGTSYQSLNGSATDADFGLGLPSRYSNLVCSVAVSTCNFPVAYSGTGDGSVNCQLSFTVPSAGASYCAVTLDVSDGTGLNVRKTIGLRWPEDKWIWMSGSDGINSLGNYGVKGVASADNVPGGRIDAVTWKDASGNVWMFGGFGFGSAGASPGYLNDLWKWDGFSWTWMGGSSTINQVGVYGTKGVTQTANWPGARGGAAVWSDSNGVAWIMGGQGLSTTTTVGYLSDLWKWDGVNWTWIAGTNITNKCNLTGTKGVASSTNNPSGRTNAATWYVNGVLWMFGGNGYSSNGVFGYLNDLWKFDGVNWTWISGSSLRAAVGVYGTKGVPSSTNMPGARAASYTWKDSAGNLWLFGGVYIVQSVDPWLNDLWRWDGTYWTWMAGSNLDNQNGIYGPKWNPYSDGSPGGRQDGAMWTDAGGNFWIFGGEGFAAAGTTPGWLNDLWKWGGVNWTWASGGDELNQTGNYGAIRVAAPTNKPGARVGSVSWIDANGNMWFFGGMGFAETLSGGYMNDLWKYTP